MLFSISVMLAFVLVFGSGDCAAAKKSAHTEKADVLVSFTEKLGIAEQALIHNASGTVSFQPAPVGEGAPPGVPEPSAKDVSDIGDNQGTFTQSVIIKSEDGKVQLYIAKGTTTKVTPGKTEDGKTPL